MVLGQLDIGCRDDLDYAVNRVEELISGLYGSKFSWRRRESEYYLSERDKSIYKSMEKYYQDVKEILAGNRHFLDRLVEEILRKSVLTYKDIATIRDSAN